MSDEAEKSGLATRLVHGGHDPHAYHGFVNPPVVHASTVLFPTYDELMAKTQRYIYGRRGTPTSDALEAALNDLEGAEGTVLFPSGLAAIATALLSCLKAGDHLLMADNVYGPARAVASTTLTRFGVDVEFYDPMIGAAIADKFKPNTRAVYLESPGSLTFELPDLQAIISAVKAQEGIRTLIDNTWGTPVFLAPLHHGIDITIMAGTKYLVGHSDAMLGTASANGEAWPDLRKEFDILGQCAGPDDIYLGLRGLRTMDVRLERHQSNGIHLAKWLEARPEVARVYHPALESHPQHDIWKRDFCGACGLFAFELKPVNERALAAMMDSLTLYGMGYSWGGYESLAVPVFPGAIRSATHWADKGPLIRIHAGLEALDDLVSDMENGLNQLAKTIEISR